MGHSVRIYIMMGSTQGRGEGNIGIHIHRFGLQNIGHSTEISAALCLVPEQMTSAPREAAQCPVPPHHIPRVSIISEKIPYYLICTARSGSQPLCIIIYKPTPAVQSSTEYYRAA